VVTKPVEQVRPRLENQISIPVPAQLPIQKATPSTKLIAEFASPAISRFNSLLHAAIDQRVGAPYVFGAVGPYAFDCSGFVWSAFQAAGIPFERSSARSLWVEFAPAKEDEKLKFGTLVFFNGLSHIGIVADANGFYHASRSHGVTYSTFAGYWEDRIDGFRRVPVGAAVPSE